MKNKDRIEDYSKAIESAMKILQCKQQIKELQLDIRSRLTCTELQDGDYEAEQIQKAFAAAGVGIKKADYVKAIITLGLVEVSLHESPEKLSTKAMRCVMKEAGMSNA
ncbi:hypothetical protein [Serratia fonticola]|uniref:hypothetical protein n=1 Tax=Serratia fonticola TaxID=47917 RepID=UPI003AAB3BB7